MIYWIFVFFLGTIFGSFSHLLVDRNIRQISIIYPRSHCPNCKHKISNIDLIPLISFIMLRGKCRNCNYKISLTYPLFELLGAVLSVLVFRYGITIQSIIIFFSLILCLVISAIDIKSLYIDMVYIYILMFLGLIYRFFYLSFNIGFLKIVLIFSFIFLFIYIISKRNIGDGDYFFYLSLFLFIKNENIVEFLFYSIWIGAFFAIIMAIKRKSTKIMIAFCPYIFLSYLYIINI
ncbi:A24 family peptidase [Anaerococcus porci]|uniref:Prepilin peptidase n=1 Tax=Anaerococcus porci TaxID=2652269 RepID=A0A6N7VE74_9FIRM|nr:A24 family peptidase [Anaerococcus porci]MDY3006197.1 prepilin peptidase [Anaerococcus porci]MSS77171.1 prepilin peptidase [Anaerococcus porci]